ADCEITLEANPGTFEAEKFRGYREAGVNRLSIGIQSFEPKHLKALGRIHDDREARRAIDIAQKHFDNINLDLMVALPEQTLAEARADAEAALAAGTFVERTGLQIAVAEKPLREAEARGLIARDHERIRPTDLGQRFLNDLLELFLPDAERA